MNNVIEDNIILVLKLINKTLSAYTKKIYCIMFDDFISGFIKLLSWQYEMQILVSCLKVTSATKLFFAIK